MKIEISPFILQNNSIFIIFQEKGLQFYTFQNFYIKLDRSSLVAN
jgi:hypothetical protein